MYFITMYQHALVMKYIQHCGSRRVWFTRLVHLASASAAVQAMLMITTRPVMHMSRRQIACRHRSYRLRKINIVYMIYVCSGHGQWVWLQWPTKGCYLTNCDTRGLYWRTLKPVFHQFQHDYELLRCLDVKIWRFRGDDNRQDRLLDPLHMHTVYME